MSDRPRWSRIPPEVAKRPDLSDRAKVIYGVLRDRSDQEGYCYPTLALIARDVGRTARTILRGLAELEGAGVLERRPQWHLPDSPQLFDTPGDGRERSSNRYRVLIGVGDSSVTKGGDSSVRGDSDRVGDSSVVVRGDRRRGVTRKRVKRAHRSRWTFAQSRQMRPFRRLLDRLPALGGPSLGRDRLRPPP